MGTDLETYRSRIGRFIPKPYSRQRNNKSPSQSTMDVPVACLLSLLLLTCLCWPTLATDTSGVQSLPVLEHSPSQSTVTYPVNTTAVNISTGFENVTVIFSINEYHPTICCYLGNRGTHAYNGNTRKTHPTCTVCELNIYKNHRQLQCIECQGLVHMNCSNVSLQTYKLYKARSSLEYTCYMCALPRLNDSWFDTTSEALDCDLDTSDTSTASDTHHTNWFENIRSAHPRRFIMAYLNIKSLSHKIVDIISETD